MLGPVGVRGRDGRLAAPPPTARALLAALGLALGEVKPAERLRAEVWPAGEVTRVGLQTAVHRLRRWLRDHAPAGTEVETAGSGYRLVGRTDLAGFRALVRRADQAGGLEGLALLTEALARWTGDPLADVPPGRRDEAAVQALVNERLSVTRRAAAVAVRAGDPDRAVEWLGPLAAQHPLDEPTQAALIAALVAAGRPAEARDRYDHVSHLLADRLGLDISDRLASAYRQLLRPVPPGRPAVAPCTLPIGLADFTGRSVELAAVRRALRQDRLVVIWGLPGSGATALAVHAAHGLRDAFPAGQLFATGADVLAQFARQLPAPRPDGAELLLVADGVLDVAALLSDRPAGPALIVTTRTAPPAGPAHVRLVELPTGDARELFVRVAGRPWQEAFEPVVRACHGSPGAVRVAGALLAKRPHWTVEDLIDHLAIPAAGSSESDR